MEEELQELKDKYGDIKFLNMKQVSEHLGLNQRTVAVMVESGKLETIKVGKLDKVKMKVLAKFLGE